MKECINIKRKIAVVGAAGGNLPQETLETCTELGRQIAARGYIIVTGACPGLPHAAVCGAKERGGWALGISPALCLDEHRERYESPYEEYDTLVFCGSGLMGREVHVIRTADIILVAGGRSGTLGEFSIAYDDGNIIGVLEGSGGIADHIRQIANYIDKDTGTEIVYDEDPGALLDKTIARHDIRIDNGTAYTINESED